MNSRFGALVVIASLGASTACFADDAPQYGGEIRAKIATAAYYPESALDHAKEGVVGLAVVIGDSGSITEAIVEHSSGVKSLDDAAISAVQAAAPFAKPPAGVAVVHAKLKYVLEY